MKITILGCGGSGGVPVIGGRWGRCDPSNPKNRRRRCSILVEQDDARLLIDTSPDLRDQLLSAGVSSIDAVAWTHAHADHVNGLDDLRGLNRVMGRRLPAWGDAATLEKLFLRFGYVFDPIPDGAGFYKPALDAQEITGPFAVGSLQVTPFAQDHGYGQSLGFRFGRAAYSTDVVALDEAAFQALDGVDLWIVDCFRIEPGHPTHSHLARTLDWIARIKPRRALLTHMGEGMDYDEIQRLTPAHVEPAFDGLMIRL